MITSIASTPLGVGRSSGHSSGRRLLQFLLAAPAAVLLCLLTAVSASAHVHVLPDSTVAGSFSALTFRVPNESDTAGTVGVTVSLPTAKPFLSVSVKPVPGWTASLTSAPLPKPTVVDGTTITTAVRTVTWTAAPGTQIGPGQYQEFSISVGPLPGPGTITLPTTQTYSDGSVVTWDQPTPKSGTEPEHPTPQFVVTAASPAPGTGQTTAGSSDDLARVLGGLGLLAGVAALVVSLTGRRRATGEKAPR